MGPAYAARVCGFSAENVREFGAEALLKEVRITLIFARIFLMLIAHTSQVTRRVVSGSVALTELDSLARTVAMDLRAQKPVHSSIKMSQIWPPPEGDAPVLSLADNLTSLSSDATGPNWAQWLQLARRCGEKESTREVAVVITNETVIEVPVS